MSLLDAAFGKRWTTDAAGGQRELKAGTTVVGWRNGRIGDGLGRGRTCLDFSA